MTATRRTDHASCRIAATHAAVYGAFTDPQLFLSWLPPDGMTGRLDHFDMRAGGSFRIGLRYDVADPAHKGKTSADEDVGDTRILSLVPEREIVWAVDFASDDPAFTGTMTMRWRFRPIGRGTEVEITAEDVPPGISAADHAEGLASSLANLKRVVEGSTS